MDKRTLLKRAIDSRLSFGILAVSFIVGLGIATQVRAGKDLKVGLYGVYQVASHKSPYDNPLDPPRPLYRYAPAVVLLQSPFFLSSDMVAPYEYKHIGPSVFAWYGACLVALFFCCFFLLRMIPVTSSGKAFSRLKLSLLMAMPLIGYELSNGQNKLVALFFMLAALYFFENKKTLLSSFFYGWALTVYLPLLVFILYFILRSRGRYVIDFLIGILLVFFVLPSLVFGFDYNNFLLNDWFTRCMKPFFAAGSFQSYIDLRWSSQSLPSALGRLFVSGTSHNFKYLISPQALHALIRLSSMLLVFFSCLAVLRQPEAKSRGLGHAAFFILALILPQYCIYYSWAWLFVVYFAVFTYTDDPAAGPTEKKILLWLAAGLFASSWLIGVDRLNVFSLLFWATLAMWAGLVFVLIRRPRAA